MRRGALILLTAVLAVAAVGGVLLFFNARDESTIGEDRTAPGRPAPQMTSRVLEQGNVVLRFGDPAHRAPLRTLADDIAGPPEPALVEAGQAILVERRPGQDGVVGEAYGRRVAAASPRDPELRRFAEYWLGRSSVP